MNKDENNYGMSSYKLLKMINDKEINSPYHINIIFYACLLIVPFLLLIFSECSTSLSSKWSNVLTNISLGCFSSSFVALLIEISTIRYKNIQLQKYYSLVYLEPTFCIKSLVESWSEISNILFKNVDYKLELHNWIEWYNIFLKNYNLSTRERKYEILLYVNNHLKKHIEDCIKSLTIIKDQRFTLVINDLYNDKINDIIEDLLFELKDLQMFVPVSRDNIDAYILNMDAIMNDLKNSFSNWKDISFINYYNHSPNKTSLNKTEYLEALIKSRSNVC